MKKADKSVSDFKSGVDKKMGDMAAAAGGWGDTTGKNYAGGLGGRKGEAQVMAASVAGVVRYGLKVPDAYGLGQAIGDGFAGGMQSSLNSVIRAAGTLAAGAVNKMHAVAMAQSPSKVTHQLGVWLGMGLVNGMDSQRGAVAKSAGALLNLGSLDMAPRGVRAAAVASAAAGSGGSNDLLAEVQGLRADIRGLPKAYQMGSRQMAT
jgi:hypothetical protein